jgi:hypothetical protein
MQVRLEDYFLLRPVRKASAPSNLRSGGALETQLRVNKLRLLPLREHDLGSGEDPNGPLTSALAVVRWRRIHATTTMAAVAFFYALIV